MMSASSEKIPVAVLGATGTVGQRFVQLLSDHPWFELAVLCGSERSAGRVYREVCSWRQEGDMPAGAADRVVEPLRPDIDVALVFSALPGVAARRLEPSYARAGKVVCTNASAFRQEAQIPLLIPELNADHIELIERQRAVHGWAGLIAASPNCTTTGIAVPLKALDDAFGVRSAFVVSMQAVSGAGHPGVASLDILGNVLPYIPGEEEKIEPETRLLLGKMVDGERVPHRLSLSAQCNRVPVLDGHTSCISVALDRPADAKEAAEALAAYRGPDEVAGLPGAPEQLIVVRPEADRPQPRLDIAAGEGMSISVGRLRPCSLLDLKFVSVVHNTLRGAASGAILNAELLVQSGYVPAPPALSS